MKSHYVVKWLVRPSVLSNEVVSCEVAYAFLVKWPFVTPAVVVKLSMAKWITDDLLNCGG